MLFPDLPVFLLLLCIICGPVCFGSEPIYAETNRVQVDARRTECQSSHKTDVATETCSNNAGSPVTSVSGTAADMAVVLYDESVFSPFHIEKRTFNFGDIRVDISQDWKNAGVAAVVWEAAVVLGEHLEQHRSIVRGLSVLELGAGTGLAGIVAALSGGRVTITDRAMALDILKKNVNLNRQLRELDVEVRELEWGRELHEFPKYRVVLGADIIYIEETFNDLVDTLLHVCDAHTVVLLSCKIRYSRDSRFLTMVERYFTVTEVYFEERRDIHIYQCIKR